MCGGVGKGEVRGRGGGERREGGRGRNRDGRGGVAKEGGWREKRRIPHVPEVMNLYMGDEIPRDRAGEGSGLRSVLLVGCTDQRRKEHWA